MCSNKVMNVKQKLVCPSAVMQAGADRLKPKTARQQGFGLRRERALSSPSMQGQLKLGLRHWDHGAAHSSGGGGARLGSSKNTPATTRKISHATFMVQPPIVSCAKFRKLGLT